MLRLLTITILLYSIGTVSAFALDLTEAKNQGIVGEQPDGYLGAVNKTPSDEVEVLINDINNKRRAKYQEISARNGQPLSVVEKLAAGKALAHAKSGHYLKKDGNWTKKK